MSFFDYPTPVAEAPESPPFLDAATDADWDALRAHSEVFLFGAGQHVVRAGDVDRWLAVVLRGEVEVRVPRRGRRRQPLVLGEGAVLGEIAFFDGAPRSTDVIARTEVEVLRLSFDRFEALSTKDPRLGRLVIMELGRTLAQRLRRTNALLGTVT